MEFCVHDYATAINLANAYGYSMCKLCGKAHPKTNYLLATAKTDGRDYTPPRKKQAIRKICNQPFFRRMK